MRRMFVWLMVFVVACPNVVRTNEALWASKKPAHYAFTFRRSCFCAPPATKAVVLEVRDSALLSATYADGSGSAALSLFADVAPLEKLFGTIERAQSNGYDVKVVYDASYGFPSKIEASKNVPDASYTFTVTAFSPME